MSHCPFFEKCGACLFRDMPFDEYIKMKKESVLSLFDELPEKIEFISIPEHTRRRVNFSFFKSHMGYNEKKSHQIVDVTECPLLRPELNRLIVPLRELLASFHSAGDVFLLVMDKVDIYVREKKKTVLKLPELERLTSFAQTYDLAQFRWNGDIIYKTTQDKISSSQFLQPSAEGEKALQTAVSDVFSSFAEGDTVWDLFAGSGTFSRPLVQKGFKVLAIDSDGEALNAYAGEKEKRDLFNFPVTYQELKKVKGLVLDPPRAGALAEVREIVQSRVEKIAMVSCNPKTFVRDMKILSDSYRLDKLTIVDQFLYSPHAELVAELTYVKNRQKC